MNLLIDAPIEKSNQDKLGRVEFAKSLAKMLLTTKNNDGIVVLLNGEWGSGKTSVINLTKEQINNLSIKNKELEFIPMIHDFSPWNVVNQDGIISQFFDTFSSGFIKERIKKALKNVKDSKVFKTVFKTINYIPFLKTNPAWMAVNSLKKKFDKYAESFNENKNLLERKNEIVQTLKRSWTRHIVFIDDLDRLNDNEIKLVIQLIKSVCNFPNVIYVVSADSKIIQSALRNEQSFNSNGDKYLDKIIQATFDIPSVKQEYLLEIAIQDLDNLFSNIITDEEKQHFQSYRFDGLLNSLKTIRDEKRFINLLSVTKDAYLDELDIADFIAITYLKNTNPKIIQLLSDYSEHLFGKYYYDSRENASGMEEKFKKELLSICNDDSLFSIIKKMFPRMFASYYYADDELYYSKRICSRNRFNLYLTQQLDADDFSIKRFNNAIESKKYEDLVNFAKTLTALQGRKFLLLLVSFVNKSNKIEECDFIAKFLLMDLSKVGVKGNNLFVSKDIYTRDFIKKLCEKYGSENAYVLILKYINELGDIYTLSELAIELNLNDLGKKCYDFDDKKIKKITTIVCELIINRLKNNELLLPTKNRCIRLVFNQNKKKLKDYFDSLNNKKKICFLTDMIWIGSITGNKKHLTFIYSIDWIKYLIDEKSLSILLENEFNDLNNCEKQRIIVLKMQINNFKQSKTLGNDKFYICDDVTRYCELNNIDFIGNDNYEKSN